MTTDLDYQQIKYYPIMLIHNTLWGWTVHVLSEQGRILGIQSPPEPPKDEGLSYNGISYYSTLKSN